MAEGFDFLLLLFGIPIIFLGAFVAFAALVIGAVRPPNGPSDPT
jgi:hypothetical protein